MLLQLKCCSCTETFTVAITHGFSANRLYTFIFVHSSCLQTFIPSIWIHIILPLNQSWTGRLTKNTSQTFRVSSWHFASRCCSFPDQLCCQSSSAVHIKIPLLVSRHSVCKSSPLRKSLTFTKVTGFNLYGGWKFQLSGPQCVGLSSKLLQMKRAGGSLNYSKWNKRLCHSTVWIRQKWKGDTFQQEGVHPFYAYFSRLPDLWNMQDAGI